MKKHTVLALLICASLAMPIAPVYAAPTDESCDVDEMMEANRKKMDEMAVGIYEQNLQKPMAAMIESAPNVKDASCLPILDTMDTLVRLRIPSLGALMGGLMAKIRDMACKFANDFIASVVTKFKYNVSDPYGIASVGVGGTADGSGGTQVERYDFGKVVSDAVAQAAQKKAAEYAKEGSKGVLNQIMSPTNNRTPRVESSVKQGVDDVFKNL